MRTISRDRCKLMVTFYFQLLTKNFRSSSPISSAASGLLSLPSLLLSMYRASAPNFYAANSSGNMFLYNDSLYLAEQLRLFVNHHESRSSSNGNSRLNLNDDIAALVLFGKRAYGKAMETERTILADQLEGAQGFANCTVPPFKEQCDGAVSFVVDYLRRLHEQWKPVLSNSALHQSIGSLLSTVTNKIIVAIEDMSDIEETESQQLTAYCNRIAALDDLFLPEKSAVADSENGGPIPLTAVYTPGWLKLQYLSNILESSLVDINYMWRESELSLEFEPREVIDLIEALFADSDYRRKAINEIMRNPRKG